MTSGKSPSLTQAQEALAERMATGICTHPKPPCEACCNLAWWAVDALVGSGWWVQGERVRQRRKEQQRPPAASALNESPSLRPPSPQENPS